MTLIDKAEALAVLRKAQIASCNCEIKTPDPEWHSHTCRYRILREAEAMIDHLPDAAIPARGVGVKDFDVEIVRGNTGGNLSLYFNDHRVAGSKPWGGGTTIHSFRVQGDEVKSSGIFATIRNAQTVPAEKDFLTTAALAPTEAAHVNETSKSEHDAGNMLTAAQAPAEDAHVKGETAGQMLERLGMDGVKWAAEFRTTALRLGYSDMDEGWLIGWFCNAIMAGYDRSAAQAREAALHPDDMLPEAIRLIRQEASRDHSQDVVTGLKHIALLLEQLINEART